MTEGGATYRSHGDGEAARGQTRRTLRVLVHPHINEANPYLRLFTHNLEKEDVRSDPVSWPRLLRDPFDVLHVHWPELAVGAEAGWKALVRTTLFVLVVTLARLRGATVVWTVHNLRSHEGWHPKLERLLMRWWTRRVDGALTLSEWAHSRALAMYPHLRDVPFRTVPHGPYPSGVRLSRTEARRELDIGPATRVALHFGHLRPYKGTHDLLEAFRDSSADMFLYVVGRARPKSYADTIRKLAGSDERIHLRLEQVPEEELQILLSAADVVVLPYRHVTHSGSVLLALSAERRTVSTAVGSMPELQKQVGRTWLTTLQPGFGPRDLESVLADDSEPTAKTASISDEEVWEHIAASARRLYDDVLASRRVPKSDVSP